MSVYLHTCCDRVIASTPYMKCCHRESYLNCHLLSPVISSCFFFLVTSLLHCFIYAIILKCYRLLQLSLLLYQAGPSIAKYLLKGRQKNLNKTH